jgi:hypothetical protein
MAAELEADLAAAESDGTSASAYVGNDPHGFALEWADARGFIRPRLALISTALVSILGAIPGAFFALFVVYGMASEPFAETFGNPERVGVRTTAMGYTPPIWLLLALYTLGAVFAYVGALAAVSAWLSWRLDPARSRTLRYLALGMPLGTAAAIFVTVGFSSTQHFSTNRSVVFADAAVAVATFTLAAAALRLAAVRRERLVPSLAR